MPSSRSQSFATLLVGSAAFFVTTVTQVFVFHSVPQFSDWIQIAVVPLVAIVLQRMFGTRFDLYIQGLFVKRSRALLGLFVLNWLLFFVPVCIIFVLSA